MDRNERKQLADAIIDLLPDNVNFTLILFEETGTRKWAVATDIDATYMGNIHRTIAIQVLRNTADRLEGRDEQTGFIESSKS